MPYLKIDQATFEEIARVIKEKNPMAPDIMTGDQFAEYIAGIEEGGLQRFLKGDSAYLSCDLSEWSDVTNLQAVAKRYTEVHFPNLKSVPQSMFAPWYVTYNTTSYSPIKSAYFDNATVIRSSAFDACTSLTTIYAPNVTEISTSAFARCSSLTEVSFPQLTTIKANGFMYCSNLSSFNAPNVTIIGESAFSGCSLLSASNLNIDFSKLTHISGYAFANCGDMSLLLENIRDHCSVGTAFNWTPTSIFSNSYLTNCDNLNGYVLSNATKLYTVSLPNVTTIRSHVFANAYVRYIYAPKVTTIGSYAFGNANLYSAIFPNLTAVTGQSNFLSNSNLSFVYFPKLTRGNMYMLYSCGMQVLFIPKVSIFENYAFLGTKSMSVYLGTTPPAHGNGMSIHVSTHFNSNYFSQHTFFIPRGYLETYQALSRWSGANFVEYDMELIIDEEEYQYDEGGMLWQDWINSEYNTIGAIKLNDRIFNSDKTKTLYNTYTDKYVNPNIDLILGRYEFR